MVKMDSALLAIVRAVKYTICKTTKAVQGGIQSIIA